MSKRLFTARLERDLRFGVPFFYVVVPTEIIETFDKRGHIPILGAANGVDLKKTTLLPSNNNEYCLALNAEIRKAANLDIGDDVNLSIEDDPEPRDLVLPDDFAVMLEENPEVKAAFERIPNFLRKYIVTDIEKAKSLDTRARRIVKYFDLILEKGKKKGF